MSDESFTWRKSSYSGSQSNCFELADLGAAVLVRNSNRPDAGTLTLAPGQMAGLVEDVKAGRLDGHTY